MQNSPSQSPPAPSSLSEAAERKKQLNNAHELMAQCRRDALLYLEAIEANLDIFMKAKAQEPGLDARFDKAVRRFYRTGLTVTGSYSSYCKAFLVTTDPKAAPELSAVAPEDVK